MDQEKKVGILTFAQFHGRADIGSSRIRAEWPTKYWPEAEIFVMGKAYDTVIYQKVYWIEHAEKFKGKKILDMCDADFLHWGYRIKQMIDLCDAVTTSSPQLATYVKKLTDKPVVCIPDRIDFKEFDGYMKKDHKGKGDTKTVAWYGYSENFPMLDSSINALADAGITDLIVIASRRSPYQLPTGLEGKIRLTNYPWTRDTVNIDLLRADIVINPQANSGRYKYKSNNKTICAWALGLPVAHNKKELENLMTEEARIKESDEKYTMVHQEYDVEQSVKEYRQLIENL